MSLIDSILSFWRTVCHPPVMGLILICATPVLVCAGWIAVRRWKRNQRRVKVRTLLVAAVISCVILRAVAWGVEVNRRGTGFIRRAVHYQWKKRECELLVDDPQTSPAQREVLERRAKHYGRLHDKFREAWACPWKPIPPDPPLLEP